MNKSIKTWQERAGYAADAPIWPTGPIEQAMYAVIADQSAYIAELEARHAERVSPAAPVIAHSVLAEGLTQADEDFARNTLAELARMGAPPAGLSLAVQLFGVGPCTACGYRKMHCRCTAHPVAGSPATRKRSPYVLGVKPPASVIEQLAALEPMPASMSSLRSDSEAPIVKIGYMRGHYEDGLQAEILNINRVYDGMLLYVTR